MSEEVEVNVSPQVTDLFIRKEMFHTHLPLCGFLILQSSTAHQQLVQSQTHCVSEERHRLWFGVCTVGDKCLFNFTSC